MDSTVVATPADTGRVVVLADGGPAGAVAMAWAEADLEAGDTDRRMILCRAGHTPFGGIIGHDNWPVALLDPPFGRQVRQARDEIGSGRVDVAMRVGHSSQALADLAGPGDTIVAAAPPLVGSTLITAIAAHVKGPLVAVRPPAEPANPASPLAGNVIVGVDDGQAEGAAIGFAFDWAERHRAAVIAVRAVPPDRTRVWFDDPRWPGGSLGDGFGCDLLDTAIDAAHRDHPQVPLRRAIIADAPGDALVLASIGAALVVVGAHRRSAVTRRLSISVSRHVLLHAHCSVAVVPHHP